MTPPPPLAGRNDRDDRLDGLRAVSAVAVVLVHTGMIGGGAIGVDVFFVLSGFLITGILAREVERRRHIDVSAFLARRAVRLMPALALVIAACALFSHDMYWSAAPAPRLDVICAALYLTDFREAIQTSFSPLAHTWSLAVEGQFYLLWPFAMAVLMRMPRPKALAALAVLWVLLTGARDAAQAFGFDSVAYYAAPFHASGLLVGAALALRPVRHDWGLVGLALLCVLFLFPLQEQAIWLITPAELAAALVISAPPRVLAWRPLPWLGVISYGIYLWHFPILHALAPVPMLRHDKVLTILLLSIAAAALSYTLVERPLQSAWRNHRLGLNRAKELLSPLNPAGALAPEPLEPPPTLLDEAQEAEPQP